MVQHFDIIIIIVLLSLEVVKRVVVRREFCLQKRKKNNLEYYYARFRWTTKRRDFKRERESRSISLWNDVEYTFGRRHKKENKKKTFRRGKNLSLLFFLIRYPKFISFPLSLSFFVFFLSFFCLPKLLCSKRQDPKRVTPHSFFPFVLFFFERRLVREREKEKHTRRERERKRLFIYIYIVLSRTPTERLAFSRREEEETTFESNRIRLVSSRGS